MSGDDIPKKKKNDKKIKYFSGQHTMTASHVKECEYSYNTHVYIGRELVNERMKKKIKKYNIGYF